MFLYLGEGKYKRKADIIGIFDMDSTTVCVTSRLFLSQKEREGCVESDGELPKSFLLCEKGEKRDHRRVKRKKSGKTQKKEYSVFLSKLSSSVLLARSARVRDGMNEE